MSDTSAAVGYLVHDVSRWQTQFLLTHGRSVNRKPRTVSLTTAASRPGYALALASSTRRRQGNSGPARAISSKRQPGSGALPEEGQRASLDLADPLDPVEPGGQLRAEHGSDRRTGATPGGPGVERHRAMRGSR